GTQTTPLLRAERRSAWGGHKQPRFAARGTWKPQEVAHCDLWCGRGEDQPSIRCRTPGDGGDRQDVARVGLSAEVGDITESGDGAACACIQGAQRQVPRPTSSK